MTQRPGPARARSAGLLLLTLAVAGCTDDGQDNSPVPSPEVLEQL